MNYEEEIMIMAQKGYITSAEEEKLISAVLEADIYQRRGL
jgi:hypothetical protein